MELKVLQYYKEKWSNEFPINLDSENTWITVISNPNKTGLSQLSELKEKFPKSTIVGCSSSGEIFKSQIFDDSLSVSICKFDRTKVRAVEVKIESAHESESAGIHIGQMLNDKTLKAVFILSDGLNINATELANGINSVVNTTSNPVVISGGLSGDGSQFKSTFTIFGKEVSSKQVVAVGLYGDKVVLGTGSVGGWDVFGPARVVTKSEGNVLFELDGQPALTLYKKYLGEQSNHLPASALLYPLSISFQDRKDVVRTILSIDENLQTMTFAGDIPQGASAQLMKANFSRLIDGAKSAGISASKNVSQNANSTLVLAVSCIGRRLVLGEEIEDEIEAVIKTLPAESQMIGFYSYGELSPSGGYGCELHNQTMTLTVIQELD